MITRQLDLGVTLFRHKQLRVHAVVNARAGRQDLNQQTQEDIELIRDARKIEAWRANRVRFYQFNSKFFRRHQVRLQHCLSEYNEV